MSQSLAFQIGQEVTGLLLNERYTLEEIQGKSRKAFSSFGRQHWPEAALVSIKAAVLAANMGEAERNGILAQIDSCANSLDELH
jgi:hypothetical protein